MSIQNLLSLMANRKWSLLLAGALIWLWRRRKDRHASELLRFRGELPAAGTKIGKIVQVNVFPSKSCKPVTIEDGIALDRRGLAYDRLVMVLDKKNNPVTQRMFPCLSLISVELLKSSNQLKLTVEQMENLEPLLLDLCLGKDVDRAITVDLHSLKGKCVLYGDNESIWINKVLSALSGRQVSGYSFACIAEGVVRTMYGGPASLLFDSVKSHDETFLSDLAPLTLLSQNSVDKLNEVISKRSGQENQIDVSRFRTNIVVEFSKSDWAFLEDEIEKIRIGNIVLRSMGPTFRCVIPTVNQESGVAGFRKSIKNAEPIATLREVRPGGIRFGLTGLIMPMTLGGSKGLAPVFGCYMGLDDPSASSIIRPGDEVEILSYKQGPHLLTRLAGSLSNLLGVEQLF